MAIVSDIEIRLRADIARLQQDMTRARQSVSSATDAMRKSLFAFAAGFSLVNIAQQVIQAQREFDKLNSSLITATGSTKAAGEAMKALQDFAARTPFSLQEVTEGFLKLRNLGLTPSERALESYGNTSAAMGKNLTQLVEAVADATTGEFERLKEFGIKAKQQGDFVSLTFQGTTTKIGNNAAEIEEYLTRIGEVNFAGGMSLQANTLDGDISRLGDTWSQTLVAFSQSGFGDAVRASVGALAGSLEDLTAIFKSLTVEAGEEGKKIDELNGVHFILTTTFETLTVLGLNLAFAFKAIGGNIGAVAAAIANPTQALSILQNRFTDLGKEWDKVNADSEKVLKAAANARAARAKQESEEQGDRLAGYKIIANETKTLSDAEIKAAAKAEEAYEALIVGLQARVEATAREAAGLAALTEAEKAHANLTEQVRSGKLKLTKVQEANARSLIDEAGANDVLAKSMKEWNDLQDQLASNAKDLASDRAAMIQSAKDEAEQNERLIETFGMTESAIIRLNAARLLEQEAQQLGRDLTSEEIEDLQRVIELKERSAKAVASRAELEQTKQFWGDIEKTAHDTFVSIADGGKNAFQRLKDTAKNTFFDWLYQQTLKKWIINIGTSVTGTAGLVGGAAAAVGGSSSGGISGSIGSAAGIAGLLGSAGAIGAGALQTAGALLAGHIGLGSTISAGVSALASGTAAGVSAGLSSLAGTLGPIALGISGAVTLISKAFGRSGKQTTASGIAGTFGADEFMGNSFREWIKKGGWFRSDKRGTDTSALNPEQAQALNSAYKTIKDSTASFAAALGVPADVVSSYSKTIRLALTGDEAKDQATLTKLFGDMGDELATRVLPNISQFIKEGETAATTLQRVATNFAGVDLVLAALGTDSQTAFRAIGLASIEARERLVALAGGIDALATQTAFFNENFLTEAERIAMIQGPLNKELERLGFAGLTTTEQFKLAVQGLIQSGALATAEGAKTFADLMAIAPQFKTVAEYLKELDKAAAETAKELAEAAEKAAEAAAKLKEQQLIDNEKSLRDAVDFALEMVKSSVDAQKNEVTRAYDEVMDRIGTRIDGLKDRIKDLTSLSDAIRGARTSVLSEEQQIASRSAARAQVQAAIAIAKASGVLPSVDSLKDALATIKLDASDQFSSLADYQREVARTNAELDVLGDMTEKQLTDAQRQILLLEDQKAIAQKQYDAEIDRLEQIAAWAQAEVDAINGVDRSVQSVVAAIAGLKVASQALNQGATPSNPSGSNLSVEQLYRTVLGREGDAAGLAYWKSVLGNNVDAKGYADFIKGAQSELEMKDRQQRQAEAANMSMSRTMSSNTAISTDMSPMQAQLDRIAAATEQFASQFNQVTAGGNAVLTEPA